MVEYVTGRPRAGRSACIIACLALGRAAGAADLPPVTDADRAAAFPDVSGTPMHRHMHEDPLVGTLRADELEWQGRSAGDALKWDVTGWLGHDVNRLWLRDERHVDEKPWRPLEILWGRRCRPVETSCGCRLDPGARTVRSKRRSEQQQGPRSRMVHVEARPYLGDAGRSDEYAG